MSHSADRSLEGRLHDREIMDRLSRGDESALQWLLAHVVPDVWPLLCRKFADVMSLEEIEDVVSQALFRIWESRTTFDADKGDLQGWFYVVARNVGVDQVRRSRREREAAEAVLTVEDQRGDAGRLSPTDEVIAKAFARLNHRERRVVAPLFETYHKQPTMRELGRKLKLSEGGVRALRFRGLRKLKEALESMGYRVIRRNANAKQRPE
jgi:RNA polymerase sigma-70 factor (ECF subfamily)